MICAEMNTVRMGEFLGHISRAHANELIVMFVDGASSRKAKDLAVPSPFAKFSTDLFSGDYGTTLPRPAKSDPRCALR